MIYELTFLMSSLAEDKKEEVFQRVLEEIKKEGGEIKDKNIEKRSFVYPVKKNKDGFLATIIFSISKDKIHNIKDFVRKEENILRNIIIKREFFKKDIETIEQKKPIAPTKFTTKLTSKPKKEKTKLEDIDKKLEEILK